MRKNFSSFRRKSTDLFDPDEVFFDSASALGREYVEHKIEQPIERVYLYLFLLVIALGFGYLALRSASLQLNSGAYFSDRSEKNRFLTRPLLPPRGVIYDRFENPMVENIPSFRVVFKKNEFLRGGGNLQDLLTHLGAILEVDAEFFFGIGFPRDYDSAKAPESTTLGYDVPLELVAALYAALDRLPGVTIIEGYRREYKNPYANSHVLGFIGKAGSEDLKKYQGIEAEEWVGKSGVEAFYDGTLRGEAGKKFIEVDSSGRETRFKLTQKPQEGFSIFLTIDQELQRVAYEIIEAYVGQKTGASFVALDPRDGAVRALVSYPGFNITQFSSFLKTRDFETVLKNPQKPFFNRAISGEFPPGSTIKPLIAAAALEEKLLVPTKQIYDEGFISIPNPYRPEAPSIFKDWKVHGLINLYDAIAYSANVYFYMIGGGYKDQKGLGIERIKHYAGLFGLGEALGIDLPGEKSGFIPGPESKATFDPNNPVWRIGDTYNVSIGQGGVKATPLQIAAMTSAIANGGTLFKPRILEAVRASDQRIVRRAESAIIRQNMVSREAIADVVRGMRGTVTYGTAGRLAALPVAVAAKTGTAEAGSGLPHAWVAVFAPAENPTIAAVIMVEHAGEGSTVAMPIMRDILGWYVANRNE